MQINPLAVVHEGLGAFLVQRAGIPIPAYYADAALEHLTTRKSVGLFDLSSAGKIHVRGPERKRFLNGILTFDLRNREVGDGGLSMLLSANGGIRSLLRVLVLEDEIVLLTPSLSRSSVIRTLRELVAATDVEIADESPMSALISLQGPQSDICAARILGAPVPKLAAFHCARVESRRFGPLTLIRSPRTGEIGLDLLVPVLRVVDLFRALLQEVTRDGGVPAGLSALDSLRIEAGFPMFGADVNEQTTPHEAGLVDGVIDFEKGCFLGQDAVAAVEFRGAPERRFRGIAFGSKIPPVVGDRLFADDEDVGSVTSSCFAPSLGHAVALALLASPRVHRRTAVRTADGEIGVVSNLPFARD